MNPVHGSPATSCWCSSLRDLQVGGNPWQFQCESNETNCCWCPPPDNNGTYSATHIGMMNFTGVVLNGPPQGGWYSMPVLGRCLAVSE